MDEKTKAVADRVSRDRGKVYRPSNGTEGEMFMSRWCDRCALDEGRGGTCDRVMRAMAYKPNEIAYPREWRIRWLERGFEAWCEAFVPLGGGGDDGERSQAA
jgi:hypothetical protein